MTRCFISLQCRSTAFAIVAVASLAAFPQFAVTQDAATQEAARHEPKAVETEADAVQPGGAGSEKSTEEKSDWGKADKDGWTAMLPKKGLGKWKVTDFGGQGDVTWDGKRLNLATGNLMTGVHLDAKTFPSENYEIRLKAQRVKGNDFFCCLTFPVGKERCSFVAGGWGGTVTGISSVNGSDASENETSSYTDFENGKWYEFRLVVTKEKVQVWIDDEECVDLSRKYAEFSTRIEVYIQEPLGICTFMTEAAIEDFKWRPFPYDEKKPGAKRPETKRLEVEIESATLETDGSSNKHESN